MKVTQNKQFAPVTITLESQDEVNKVFALFNFVPIINALNISGWSEELDHFSDDGYLKYHNKIDGMLKF